MENCQITISFAHYEYMPVRKACVRIPRVERTNHWTLRGQSLRYDVTKDVLASLEIESIFEILLILFIAYSL